MSITVDIVTPTQAVFSGQATSVRVPAWEGEFEVLEGHDIALSLLRGGITTLQTTEGTRRFVTGRGFVEAGPDRVTVLTDSCEDAASVDKSAAQVLMTEADAAKGEHVMGSAGWEAAEEKAERAGAILEA